MEYENEREKCVAFHPSILLVLRNKNAETFSDFFFRCFCLCLRPHHRRRSASKKASQKIFEARTKTFHWTLRLVRKIFFVIANWVSFSRRSGQVAMVTDGKSQAADGVSKAINRHLWREQQKRELQVSGVCEHTFNSVQSTLIFYEEAARRSKKRLLIRRSIKEE